MGVEKLGQQEMFSTIHMDAAANANLFIFRVKYYRLLLFDNENLAPFSLTKTSKEEIYDIFKNIFGCCSSVESNYLLSIINIK